MQLAMDIVDVAYMRTEPGCRELPGEFLLILARIVFDNYELFPPPPKKKRGRSGAGSQLD
jgi:hypothetical protein